MPRTALLAWLRRANCSAQESDLKQEVDKNMAVAVAAPSILAIILSALCKISLLLKFTAENPCRADFQLFKFLALKSQNRVDQEVRP